MNFVAFPFLPAYLILSQSWVISSSSEIMKQFWKVKNVHRLDVVICDLNHGVQLLKDLNQIEYRKIHEMSVRFTTSWKPESVFNGQVGVFVELTCSKNRKFLAEAEASWFHLSYTWLILDPDDFYLQTFSNGTRQSLYSDVTLLKNEEFYRVSQFVEEGPIETVLIGLWNDKEVKLEIDFPVIKPNLRQTTVRQAILDVQNLFEVHNMSQQMQDYYFKNGFDGGNRFFYSVSLDVADIYNFSINLMKADEWGHRKPNGTWDGIMGLLQRDEAEFHTTPLLPMSQRLEVSYALPALQNYWLPIVFRQTRAMGTYRAMTLELDPIVWFLVGLLTVIGGIVFWLSVYRQVEHGDSLDVGLVQSVGIMANQGLSFEPKGTASRIVCLSLLTVGLLVSNYYNAATMTALLREAPPTIKNLDQLIKSSIPVNLVDAFYMTDKGSRSRKFYPNVYEKVEKDLRILTMKDGMEAVRKGEAFAAQYYDLFEGLDKNFNDDEKCEMTIFSLGVTYTAMRYVRLDKHLLEMLSRGLIKTLEFGMAQKKRTDWITGPPTCNRPIPFIFVQLEAVSVAFGILTGGGFLSCVIVIAELMYFRRRKISNVKPNRIPSESKNSSYPLTAQIRPWKIAGEF